MATGCGASQRGAGCRLGTALGARYHGGRAVGGGGRRETGEGGLAGPWGASPAPGRAGLRGSTGMRAPPRGRAPPRAPPGRCGAGARLQAANWLAGESWYGCGRGAGPPRRSAPCMCTARRRWRARTRQPVAPRSLPWSPPPCNMLARGRSHAASATRALASQASACQVRSAVARVAWRKRSACDCAWARSPCRQSSVRPARAAGDSASQASPSGAPSPPVRSPNTTRRAHSSQAVSAVPAHPGQNRRHGAPRRIAQFRERRPRRARTPAKSRPGNGSRPGRRGRSAPVARPRSSPPWRWPR